MVAWGAAWRRAAGGAGGAAAARGALAARRAGGAAEARGAAGLSARGAAARGLSSGGAGKPAAPAPKVSSAPAPPPKDVTIHTMAAKKKKGVPITMVTAYDFPSAVHVDKAGIDIVLIGDSVGMVELGYETTIPVTLDEIIHHCKAVVRGCRRPLLVGDMPFGTYEVSAQQASLNAIRLMKETGVDCVKVEGGLKRIEAVKAIVHCGIAVMGHIGLTPQAYSGLGGFKSQGKTAAAALDLIKDAQALEEAGAFATVIECVPAVVAREVARAVRIPVIGIGAGPYTDGQVLVYHDMLGMLQHHHHAQFTPMFCKQYATVGYAIQEGLANFRNEVERGEFPDANFSPYKISPDEERLFLELVKAKHAESGGARAGEGKEEDNPDIKVY
jgi:3-methyl-2-oxobutanoate hydroxymethyltransferase